MQILTTETYTALDGLGIVAILVGGILMAVGLFYMIVGVGEDNWLMAFVGLTMFVVGILVAYHLHDVDSTEYLEHQVVITDIQMVIDEGYEIVDMDGKLATIQKPLKEESE